MCADFVQPCSSQENTESISQFEEIANLRPTEISSALTISLCIDSVIQREEATKRCMYLCRVFFNRDPSGVKN